MILSIFCGIFVVSIVFFLIYKPRRFFEKNGIKYLKPIPIFGEMMPIVLKRMSLFENIQRIYHEMDDVRFFGYFIFLSPALLIKDPELIKQIAIKDFDNFMDHSNLVSNEIDTILGNSLLTLKGQQWRKFRMILTPAFTGSKMRAMFSMMMKCSDEFNDYLSEECHGQKVTTIDVKEAFTKVTNNVISVCAFGLENNSFINPNNEFYLISKAITDLRGLRGLALFLPSLSLNLMKILKVSFLKPHETDFFRRIFLETIKYREENKIVKPDMIHLLMQAKEGQLRDEETETADERNKEDFKLDVDNDAIIAQAVTFVAAGFANSSTLLCFASYELALNPDVQNKLHEEIDYVLSKTKGTITYESLTEMKYLDMIISETTRLYPPVPITERLCTKDFILEDNGRKIKIEKGILVTFPIAAIQRDAKYFQDPTKFEPERFSDENKNSIDAGTFLPFGIGPRNCIGNRFALLEIKLVLVDILIKYKLVPVGETEIPIKIDKSSISTIAENPIYLGLEKRF